MRPDVGRRVAVSAVVAALVLAAEVAATVSATTAHRVAARPTKARKVPLTYPGEPQLAASSTAAAAARMAAVKFVRDYAMWSSGRLAAIPGGDATPRVTRLLERQGRRERVTAGDAGASVRLALIDTTRYVVTSRAGNFLVGERGRRWLVISLPGD
jgi:hypothetical protein